tara:strand:- start:6280 stop:7470 length:1191 start_codon:yes stop_codon:yes gene_type:complete
LTIVFKTLFKKKLKQKKIYYWSPSLVNVATNKAVINSAHSINRYSKDFKAEIINFFGEFERYKEIVKKKKLSLLSLYNSNFLKFFPRHGKINSRISYVIIFLFSFFPLNRIIKKNKPDFIIIHLITSLPLILLVLFNYETKFILRVSGLPKLNFIRKFLWKQAAKKLYCITCPTQTTLENLKKLNIIDENKLKLLKDPVIEISDYKKNSIKSKADLINEKNFFLAAGRLTKQKNFLFLCKCFKKILKKYPNEKLIIAGEGEDLKKINNFIEFNNLKKNILVPGFINDLKPYFFKSKGFILTSLWEDPGFVLIEAGALRTIVLASDNLNGQNEIIQNHKNGVLFKNNNEEDFLKKFEYFYNLKKEESSNILINNYKVIKKYTLFYHYRILKKILEVN